MKTIEIRFEALHKEITAAAIITDSGISITAAGGDKGHIGAVAVADPCGNITVIEFPGHKEGAVASSWAKAVYERSGTAVSVSMGVHFDNITKPQIEEVLASLDKALARLIDSI